ncbi:hypothetical protein SAMN05216466_10699 [Paraburkholderia phenazinium]|uniref:Uncharacterized protein n=1 Tax=Paraburkholderia phenazinium TaxID=60549 RepID=A0A1G7YA30_9BURK|nr:hypothetical protein SAMN05216466_10699 [Paraburkholderia phenazinium]
MTFKSQCPVCLGPVVHTQRQASHEAVQERVRVRDQRREAQVFREAVAQAEPEGRARLVPVVWHGDGCRDARRWWPRFIYAKGCFRYCNHLGTR